MKLVFGIGIACLDHLIVVPETSKDGGRLRDYRIEGGGLTATALVAAARLGATTRLWSCVGDDETGGSIIRGLAREGVDTQNVAIVPGARSPLSLVQVDAESGERTIFHYRADLFETTAPPQNLDEVKQAGALLVDASWHAGALAGAQEARRAGVPVIADFDPRTDPDLAAVVDYLIVGEQVAEQLAPGEGPKAALWRLRDFGARFAAVTAGPKGCWYLMDHTIHHALAYPLEVVDTTGAGDAFHGAFAFGLADGREVGDAIRLGCAVGALCCTALGGRAGLPDLKEAESLLRDHSSPSSL